MSSQLPQLMPGSTYHSQMARSSPLSTSSSRLPCSGGQARASTPVLMSASRAACAENITCSQSLHRDFVRDTVHLLQLHTAACCIPGCTHGCVHRGTDLHSASSASAKCGRLTGEHELQCGATAGTAVEQDPGCRGCPGQACPAAGVPVPACSSSQPAQASWQGSGAADRVGAYAVGWGGTQHGALGCLQWPEASLLGLCQLSMSYQPRCGLLNISGRPLPQSTPPHTFRPSRSNAALDPIANPATA